MLTGDVEVDSEFNCEYLQDLFTDYFYFEKVYDHTHLRVDYSDYEKDDKKKSYLHVERSYGSYERSFDVSGIKLDAISVKYNDGVLAITLPKEEVKQPEARSIDVM